MYPGSLVVLLLFLELDMRVNGIKVVGEFIKFMKCARRTMNVSSMYWCDVDGGLGACALQGPLLRVFHRQIHYYRATGEPMGVPCICR